MLTHRISHALAVCAIGLLPLPIIGSATAAPPDDAITKCDVLASDPHDPGRYAAGVPDAQFAPGAAVDACKAAADVKPDLPRAWFQLGRAYWIAERDADAFAAFVKAERLGYAPAMRYLGDAYKDGRGLPSGEQQSPDTAMTWYKRAQAAGYREATTAIQDLSTAIASSTFDPSKFQNPTYMTMLYQGNFEAIDNPVTFFSYTKAFTDELGGQTSRFFDQDCRAKVTALGSAVNGLGSIFGYLQVLQGDNVALNFLGSAVLSHFAEDQGERDAATLINTYKCNNPVTNRIVDNVIGSYQKLPTIIDAFKNKDSKSDLESTRTAIPLYQQRVNPLYWGVIAGKCVLRPAPGCERVQELIRSQTYDVIQCSYGPVKSDGTGYRSYAFWHNKVPDNPLGFAIPGDDHPFLILGKVAVAKCPATTELAEPIFQTSRLSFVPRHTTRIAGE